MTSRIPNNPEELKDKLRLLRKLWIQEKVRSDKEMVKVYDMLNEIIKSIPNNELKNKYEVWKNE